MLVGEDSEFVVYYSVYCSQYCKVGGVGGYSARAPLRIAMLVTSSLNSITPCIACARSRAADGRPIIEALALLDYTERQASKRHHKLCSPALTKHTICILVNLRQAL